MDSIRMMNRTYMSLSQCIKFSSSPYFISIIMQGPLKIKMVRKRKRNNRISLYNALIYSIPKLSPAMLAFNSNWWLQIRLLSESNSATNNRCQNLLSLDIQIYLFGDILILRYTSCYITPSCSRGAFNSGCPPYAAGVYSKE